MKAIIKKLVLAILCVTSLSTSAQKAEPVYSVTRQVHNFDWYEQQAKAWKQEINNGTKDKMAWVYFFEANRMAKIFCDSKQWESKQGDYFMPLDKIIELAENAIPTSFELFYLKINDSKAGSGSGEEYILKAQEIKPFDKLLLPWLLNHYIFTNDKANIELTCKKWFESNEMPQEILITAYNNLVSLDQNAILLVYGDNDTYPCWILQNARKIRPDVLVLSLPLAARIDTYRERLFKEYGIPQLTFKGDSDRTDQNIFRHLIETVHDKSIYVSVYADQSVYKDYADKMYLTGMSFKYSKKPFDNLAVLRNNVENKFMLDFLKQTFYNNDAQDVVNMMNAGYFAVFLKLYENYHLCGEATKAKKIKELAKTLSQNTANGKAWMQYFEK